MLEFKYIDEDSTEDSKRNDILRKFKNTFQITNKGEKLPISIKKELGKKEKMSNNVNSFWASPN